MSEAIETRDGALGYHAAPTGACTPGVVLVHDVWGLADHTRDLARRLAAEGFCVLAIDLYRRESEVEITNPGVWMRNLSDPQALADLEEAAETLAADERCTGKVGVMGFCMGGMYALLSACGGRGIEASVAFYGLLSHAHGILHAEEGLDPARKPREPLVAAAQQSVPLLCLFGDRDEFVPVSDIEMLRDALDATEIESEVVLYPDCGHAFLNDTREDAYRPEEAAAAWQRAVAFLSRTLA